MTKFALFLTVCSFITNECDIPIKHPQSFNTWYDCVAAAHLNGLKMLQTYGSENINKYHLAAQFECSEVFEM
jgi:hypothetical protein